MNDQAHNNILIGCPIDRDDIGPVETNSLRSVTVQIEPVDDSHPKSSSWRATSSDGRHSAFFQIELDSPHDCDATSSPPLEFGIGRFRSVVGSDASALIASLAAALEATCPPGSPVRNPILPFAYTSFGAHLSQAPHGGFQTKPAGDWMVTKLFLGENTEEDEGQVFLALNQTAGQAKFLIKDKDYGDIVLRHLSTVL